MQVPAAVLLDVYETVLTCDFERHFRDLAISADVSYGAWSVAFDCFVAQLLRGQMTTLDGFRRTLTACGADPAGAKSLVDRDIELIVERAHIFPDVLPAIGRWRAQDVRVGLISNCTANTRPLLTALGLSDAVDVIALSCEVGRLKPEPEIYQYAAATLGVTTSETLFIDDQLRFCDGARAVGMTAARIDRTTTGPVPAGTVTTLSSIDATWLSVS